MTTTTKKKAPQWLEQCYEPLAPAVEARQLAWIQGLSGSKEAQKQLERIVRTPDCSALLRCAAVDRLAQEMGSDAGRLLGQLLSGKIKAPGILQDVASQWLASLTAPPATPGPVPTRGAGRPVTEARIIASGRQARTEKVMTRAQWRRLAAASSLRQVRWLASLEE